jgi:hypothetical protein
MDLLTANPDGDGEYQHYLEQGGGYPDENRLGQILGLCNNQKFQLDPTLVS